MSSSASPVAYPHQRRSRSIGAVSARHRGKADYSPLIALILIVVVPLAGMGLLIAVGLRYPSAILILVGAADGVLLIQAVHKVVLNLAGKQPQTAEQWADRLSLRAQLAGAMVLSLAFIGQVRGWMHGMFRDVVVGVLVVYLVAGPIYWFGGRRRLIAVLRTGATGEEPGRMQDS